MKTNLHDDQKFAEYKHKYRERGTILTKMDDMTHPIDKNEIKELSLCCKEVEKEYVSIGDAGSQNNLLVGRFMTDVDKPVIVENEYSHKVLEILSKEKTINFIKNILELECDIFIRRVQFNQIDKNCFVGYHLDTDSNPDYLAAGVIQLGKSYKGGHYRVYQKNGEYFDYISSYGDLILSNCTYPHEVTKVEEGERKSLVFFVSKNSGENRRKNKNV